MKFVPKLCAAGAILLPALLLSACSLPVPETGRVAEEAQIFVGEGSMPKPTQTTWATPESTATDQPTTQTEAPVSTLPSCDGIDPVVFFRFDKSGMKCLQLLELRARIVQEVGEQMADWTLLAYHSEFCTENGGKLKGEPLPYDPSKKSHGEELVHPVKPGGEDTAKVDTADMKLGKFVPCRQPKE